MRTKNVSKRFEIKKEDSELFRDSVGSIKRVNHDRHYFASQRPAPTPKFRRRDDKEVIGDLLADPADAAELENGDELIYSRPGLQHRLLKRLRRGQFAVEAECDLHGLTVPQARRTLIEFLSHCAVRSIYCVRIIHGKGRGSRNGIPVIKRKVNSWLRQRNDVLAFCSARGIDGGTGALYVLLRRRTR